MIPLALIIGSEYRFGKSIALELIRHGFAVCLHYNHPNEIAEPTAAYLQTQGGEIYSMFKDLRKSKNVEDLFYQVSKLPNPLRVLVISIGESPHVDLEKLSVEEWDTTFALNLRTPWLCVRAAAKLMEPEGGAIINMGDSGVTKSFMEYPTYVISAAGLDAFTKIAARHFAPRIRINTVLSGLIRQSENDTLPEDWGITADRLPLKTVGNIEDVTSVVIFFIQNSFVTGSVITVDGGFNLGSQVFVR